MNSEFGTGCLHIWSEWELVTGPDEWWYERYCARCGERQRM